MKSTFKFLLVALSVFTSTSPLHAQWVQTNGPYGGNATAFAVSGTNLFAGTLGGGVFLSTNNGTSWTAASTGLTNNQVYALAVSGTNLFAGTWGGGVFLSTNNGTSWSAVNNGLTNTNVRTLAVSGTNLFAGTFYGGVFLSTNNGASWTQVNNGLTSFYVNALAVSGTNLFAGTWDGGGVFLSSNNGTSWTQVNNGLTASWVRALAVFGTNLFAGTDGGGGVFLSTNNGTSWNASSTGLNTSVNAFAVSGTNLFAGTNSVGVLLSTNNGTSWNAVNNGLTNTFVNAFAVSGTNLFTGTDYRGVFLSTNNGTSWSVVNTGLTYTGVRSLAVSPNGAGGSNLFAATINAGVFLSTNNGTSWTERSSGLTNMEVIAFAVSGTNLFAGTYPSGVFLSTNSGTSWTRVSNGLTNFYVRSLAPDLSGNLFAGTDGGGVFLSTNSGTSWTQVNTGLTNPYVLSLAVSGTNLFAGTVGGVFLSTNSGTSWTQVNTGLTNTYVNALAVSGTNLFAGTLGGVFLSTNNGTSWTAASTGLTNNQVYALAVSGTNLFAGTWGGGVFLSTNSGTSWTAVNTGLTYTYVLSFAVSGTNLFAGTYGGGVWRRPLSEMIASSVALISPGNSSAPGYAISTLNPSFFWNAISSASNYGLQLYKQNGSAYELIYSSDNITTSSIVLPSGTITDASQYYWQVRAKVNNVWSSYSFPYYFSVSVASLTPTIFLSSSVIQTGGMMTFTGINFTRNNQARAIITSNNTYDTSITLNTNATGYLTHTLTFTAPGNYTIYCKDISTWNVSNSKSFEVRSAAPVSYFSIILPYSGYQARTNEPIVVKWKDKLETGTAYPVVGSQRGYKYLVEKSTNNGSTWQVADTVSGLDDINSIRNFSAGIIITEPSSNCLIRVRDGYVATRTTTNVSIQILATTPPLLSADFIWDYSYATRIGKPIGVVSDGTSRFYIKAWDPANTISQVTFSLFDSVNNEIRILGKLKVATNISSYDEEANSANQLSALVTQPHGNNEFWCWYVAPDDFIGLNTSISNLNSREVKVRIRAEYASGPSKEIVRTITIERPPVVLVHGLNSNPTMWGDNYFANTSSPSKFHIYKLNIGAQDSFALNARRILNRSFNKHWSIPAVIEDFRKDSIACNQIYYVGHSMGGNVLRYAETYYPANFFTRENYSKGYVNKFISLDTPHKGSPWANVLVSKIWVLNILQADLFANSGWNSFLDTFYKRNVFGFITDAKPAIKDLRMNSFNMTSTSYKSHVFMGDMLEGSEDLSSISQAVVENLNVNQAFRTAAGWLLYYIHPFGGLKRLLSALDFEYYPLSGSSISNSDLIVPLSSQLSGLSQNDNNVTRTVNFHSSVTGSPSIERTSAAKVDSLLDTRISGSVWGSLPSLQHSNSNSPTKLNVHNIVLDTNFIDVFAPRHLDTLYIDSVFNVTFSLSDTTNLKGIIISYQDRFIEDTIKQTNYTYSLSVSNNFIDTQSVTISAMYLLNDSTIVSSKTIPAIIKSTTNPTAIKSKENFVYLLKDEDFNPDVDIYFESFISKIGTTGTALNIVVADPGLLALDSRTKKLTALHDGETFAVFEYRGLRDTVYFKISGENITGVVEGGDNSNSSLPEKFELLQNYPNPFNPITTIRYEIPKQANVTLKIYNMLGQEVKTLVDEIQVAGHKTIQWDSRNNAGITVASGVYFYRMQAADFVQTKKLVLLR